MASDGGLRPLIRQRLPGVDWCTIETGLVASGVPDLNGCCGGIEFWVECKLTTAWAVEVRPMQVGWHLRRTRAGGRTWFAVRRRCTAGVHRSAADELWLIRGAAAARLRAGGLRGISPNDDVAGMWVGGPARWAWGEVAVHLVGEVEVFGIQRDASAVPSAASVEPEV